MVSVGAEEMEEGDPQNGNPLHAIEPRESGACGGSECGASHALLLTFFLALLACLPCSPVVKAVKKDFQRIEDLRRIVAG